MSKSKIEWTDETWNPTTGCAKVSAGCKNCYAEREWPRMTRSVPAYAGRDFTDVRTHADRLEQPLRWKRPRRVFVNSMSDLFHEDVPDSFIDQVFAVMVLAPQHTFQILTKRADRMREYLVKRTEEDQSEGWWSEPMARAVFAASKAAGDPLPGNAPLLLAGRWPLPNVWLGVSVEDQAAADERIPLLLGTPAAVRWISVEPLLGLVDLMNCEHLNYSIPADYLSGQDSRSGDDQGTVDWVVVGGESGPKARPMHPDWVRLLRDQCTASSVPFLFKQWGEWGPAEVTAGGDLGGDLRRGTVQHLHAPGNPEGFFRAGDAYVRRVGKKVAGRLLDGAQHDGYPVTELVR